MKRLSMIMLAVCAAGALRAQNAQTAGNVQAAQSAQNAQPAADSAVVRGAQGGSSATAAQAGQARTAEALWDAANTAYVNNDFNTAIARYDSIVAMGKVSAKLFFNLGNAYFKSGDIGRAILNFERARRLAPSNSDINYNLAIARSYTKDNIAKVPEFFILRGLRAVRTALSSNLWAWISLVALALALTAALFYLLSKRMPLRKAGFFVGLVMALLFVFTTVNSAIGRREMLQSDRAIVLNNAAPVKSSPDKGSKDIFVIHEGTAVQILSRLGDWFEVAVDDGNKGWIEVSAIEVI